MYEAFDLEVVQPQELVARYIWKDKFRKSIHVNQSVKPRVFYPVVNRETGRLELSTFRVAGLSRDEAIELAGKVAGISRKQLEGQVVLRALDFAEHNLDFDANNRPFDRHMDVIGWSDQKDLRMQIAIDLAELSRYQDKEHFMDLEE